MTRYDEEGRKISRGAHEIGEDLSNFSVEELTRRIDLLQAEVVRLTQARAQKASGRSAAESLFRR